MILLVPQLESLHHPTYAAVVANGKGGGRCISSPAITESKASSKLARYSSAGFYLCHAVTHLRGRADAADGPARHESETRTLVRFPSELGR